MTEDVNESKDNKINHTKENLESVGQMILGEVEKIGGILTGDPVTQAEGDFNLENGEIRHEANKNLTAMDDSENKKPDES